MSNHSGLVSRNKSNVEQTSVFLWHQTWVAAAAKLITWLYYNQLPGIIITDYYNTLPDIIMPGKQWAIIVKYLN